MLRSVQSKTAISSVGPYHGSDSTDNLTSWHRFGGGHVSQLLWVKSLEENNVLANTKHRARRTPLVFHGLLRLLRSLSIVRVFAACAILLLWLCSRNAFSRIINLSTNPQAHFLDLQTHEKSTSKVPEVHSVPPPQTSVTSSRRGASLGPSTFSKPGRVDRHKLVSRLDSIFQMEIDEDNEDDEFQTDDSTDDILEVYGLMRWPPRISRVPEPSAKDNEDRKSLNEMFDLRFCLSKRCKVLLPAWISPLPLDKQQMYIRHLFSVARRLNRTLVIPNVGLVSSHNSEEPILPGLGTCHRHMYSRYFDVLTLLTSAKNSDGSRVAASMQAFLEWTKYRPLRPTAQMVVVDSTFGSYYTACQLSDWNVRVDRNGDKSRGRHNNCLSSRAHELDFKTYPPVYVSRTKRNSSLGDALTNLTSDADCLSYLDRIAGVTGVLGGDMLYHHMNPAYDSASGSLSISDTPQVLVIEWDGDHDRLTSEPNTVVLQSPFKDSTLRSPYALRLQNLASRLTNSKLKPVYIVIGNWQDLTDMEPLESIMVNVSKVLNLSTCRSKKSDDNGAANVHDCMASHGVATAIHSQTSIRGTIWLTQTLGASMKTEMSDIFFSGVFIISSSVYFLVVENFSSPR